MQDLDMEMTKDDIWDGIQKDAEEYPELSELKKYDNTKAELIAAHERATSSSDQTEPKEEEQGDEPDPTAVFERFLKEAPEAVMVPKTSLLMRLQNPNAPSMEFTIKGVEGELGMELLDLEDVARTWRTPENTKQSRFEPEVAFTRLDTVPEWAQGQVIELVDSGDLALYTSAAEADSEENDYSKQHAGLLDTNVGQLDMDVVYAQDTGAANPPMIVEPTGKFTSPEQEAAWNALNGFVEGEPPLPDNPDEVSEDPSSITRTEFEHVKSRLDRAMERPESFTERTTSADVFDQRTFFNQLLQIEHGGFTPQRNSLSKQGGVRKKIVKLIRQKAKDKGFEVMGDYVIQKQERGDFSTNMPTEQFTQNRTPDLPFNAGIGVDAEKKAAASDDQFSQFG